MKLRSPLYQKLAIGERGMKWFMRPFNFLFDKKYKRNTRSLKVIDQVCKNLRITTLGYSAKESGKKWHDIYREALNSESAVIANHGKLMFIDDSLFYVGSQNIYPASLGEFGVIVDDEVATQEAIQKLWTPAWENSFVNGDHHFVRCVEKLTESILRADFVQVNKIKRMWY